MPRKPGMKTFTKIRRMQGIVICLYLSSKQLCHKRHSAAMIAGV
jgi:hypothetical protein